MKTILLIFIFLSLSFVSHAKQDPIETVNKHVAILQAKISRGELPFIEINDVAVTEGKPPEFKLYYSGNSLIAALISVGHESWSVRFSYFFYEDGTPMKFTKVVQGRSDIAPRQGIIFDRNGKILWSDISVPPVDPAHIQDIFHRFSQLRGRFSEY
ncbi:MAG: hypothetical protein PHF56_13085 [Desulfuromonadaceae bacterium]|nr:hypothetical protein [Desulfuromonadaceae bacterium]